MASIEKVGARIYVVDAPFALKDTLKAAGCHWDAERRQWWIGAAKAAAVEAIVGQAATGPAEKPKAGDDTRVVAKAKYKGRTYYCPFAGTTKSGERKARLVTLDGSIDFWATIGTGPDEAEILKTYQPRTHTFRGHTETRYTTLGSIRAFIGRESANRKAGGAVCAECGTSGDLVEDLEDGLMKHYQCCDMPRS